MSAALGERERKELEQRLHALHERILGDLEDVERDALGKIASPSERQGDEGVRDATQETDLGILEQDELVLAEVVEALGRLDEGTFGRCEDCGAWIALERLRALPYARRCAVCEERYGRGPGLR